MSLKKSKTLTILSDSPFLNTGYSDQSKKIAKYFSEKGWIVHWLANGYVGQPIKYAELKDGTKFNYTIWGQIGHQYFADTISTHLKETKSDILLVILDTFMLHGDPKNPQNGWFLNTDTSPAQVVFWYPSDGGGGMPVGCDLILKKCERAVAYSKFAQKQVKDYYNLDTPYIPLGTDPDRFYKLPDEQIIEAKKKYNVQNKFVVGVVARNQPRKFLDRTIKTFRLVANNIPEAVLILHLDPNDPAQAFNIGNLIRRYNLENRVLFTGMKAQRSFDWNEMNELYNAFDVFFLSTSGEGWGIPLCEAMSCQIPVVATDYTTTQEIIKDNKCGFGAKLSGTDEVDMFKENSRDYDTLVSNGTLTGSWEVERGFCDINDACKKIVHLYNNPDLRNEFGENGRNAVLTKYDMFNVVCPAFEKLFKEMLE